MLRFHNAVKGVNISLEGDDTVACRKHGEYYLGYVFTERPIKIDEKIAIMVDNDIYFIQYNFWMIQVLQVEDAFSGSLAFGLTSCDPNNGKQQNLFYFIYFFFVYINFLVPSSRLPVDSDELLERPEYWVCIKDVGAMPTSGDRLSFVVDNSGNCIIETI